MPKCFLIEISFCWRDEAVPAAERLGVFGGVGIIGGHVAAHERRGVPGDVQAGLEAVLQAHAGDRFGVDAVPGVLGLEQRFGSVNRALIGSGALDGRIAHPTWLEVHVCDPFGWQQTCSVCTRKIPGHQPSRR